MSNIKYGLISETDARTLEKTIDLICNEFSYETEISSCEIGVFDGQTSRGIYEYVRNKGYMSWHTAIDNNKDKEVLKPFPECNLIIGNSNEVYNQIPDGSQHLIIIDANHSFPSIISDYYCYRNKLKNGGFLCFHDSAPQAQGLDWQRIGDEKDPDMSISVRKALTEIGILDPIQEHSNLLTHWYFGWTKVFDEFDPNDRCGGFIVYKKKY